MKLLKKWTVLVMSLIVATSICALAACDNGSGNTSTSDSSDAGQTSESTGDEEEDNSTGGGETTTYTFEAEYTDLTGLNGFGPSGSPSGLNLIVESSQASNGFYLNCLGPSSPITFVITSSEATTATLRGIFGSNSLGSCEWNTTTFTITVNGTAFDYTSFTTTNGSSDNPQNFSQKNLGTINLVEGENTIVLCAGTNTYLNNMSSAPSIDCIKLTTTATLTMDELTSNLD